jgi:hypothetical protein
MPFGEGMKGKDADSECVKYAKAVTTVSPASPGHKWTIDLPIQ